MHRADRLDIAIIKELQNPSSFQWDVRKSYASVAETLGVDEETVRKRLARMREDGVLRGWVLVVNPRAIGREAAAVDLDVEEVARKPSAISQIKLIEGVVSIISFQGTGLRAVIFYESERDLVRLTKLMASICVCQEPTSWKLGFPACEIRLDKMNWQILKSLRYNPRRRLPDVARDLGVSARTVKRRLERLTKSKAFFLSAIMDSRRLGGIGCNFLVLCPDPARKRVVDQMILSKFERVGFVHTASERHSSFTLLCDNVPEANDACGWIKELGGIEEVRMGIEEDVTPVLEWLDGEIEKQQTNG